MVHIQIIDGEVREIEVAEKSKVAVPPGTEIIFESTLAALGKIAKMTAKKVVDDLCIEKGLVDKRKK
jgi:hypothetical protein